MKHYLTLSFIAMLFVQGANAQNTARFSNFKPGMIDEALMQQALKVANRRAIDRRCPEDYTNGVITSLHWDLEFDNSGFVQGRTIHIELYCKKPTGSCGIANFTFRQKHQIDGDFARKLQIVHVSKMYEVMCE